MARNTLLPWGKNLAKRASAAKVSNKRQRTATPDKSLFSMDYPPNKPALWPIEGKVRANPNNPSIAEANDARAILDNAYARAGYVDEAPYVKLVEQVEPVAPTQAVPQPEATAPVVAPEPVLPEQQAPQVTEPVLPGDMTPTPNEQTVSNHIRPVLVVDSVAGTKVSMTWTNYLPEDQVEYVLEVQNVAVPMAIPAYTGPLHSVNITVGENGDWEAWVTANFGDGESLKSEVVTFTTG